MNTNSVLTAILSSVKEKYKWLNQIFEATKGLECMSLDDTMSLSSFLSTRQTAMNNIDKLDAKIKELVKLLSADLRDKVNKLLSPIDEPITDRNPFLTDLYDANKRNFMLLKKIVDSDARLNKNIQKIRSVRSE